MTASLIVKYPLLECAEADICSAIHLLESSFRSGGKLLAAGNGGSCADADHIAGELLKGFLLPRRIPQDARGPLPGLSPEETREVYQSLQQGLPVIPLSSFPAFMTAYMNDENPDMVYAQLVQALGQKGDVFLGISTSGNSKNIIRAASLAKNRGLKVLALTGRSGGHLAELSDICIRVPADATPDVQELHLPVYHLLCSSLEQIFFGG